MTTSNSTSEFDDLARLVNGGLRNGVTPDDFLMCRLGNNSISEYVVDAIVRAGYSKPRTIETVEKLDALPDGTIIRDAYGPLERHTHARTKERGWYVGDSPSRPRLPAVVLWEPSV